MALVQQQQKHSVNPSWNVSTFWHFAQCVYWIPKYNNLNNLKCLPSKTLSTSSCIVLDPNKFTKTQNIQIWYFSSPKTVAHMLLHICLQVICFGHPVSAFSKLSAIQQHNLLKSPESQTDHRFGEVQMNRNATKPGILCLLIFNGVFGAVDLTDVAQYTKTVGPSFVWLHTCSSVAVYQKGPCESLLS